MPAFKPVERYELITLNTPGKSTIQIVKGTIPSLDGKAEHTVYGYSINGEAVPDSALSMDNGLLVGMLGGLAASTSDELSTRTGYSLLFVQHRFEEWRLCALARSLSQDKGEDSEEYKQVLKELEVRREEMKRVTTREQIPQCIP